MKTQILCCYLSLCAYEEDIKLDDIKDCGKINTYHSDIDAQCFTVVIKNTLYISFRGTESFRDCLSDINVIQVPMDLDNIPDEYRPNVHWGFLRQFRSLQKFIEKDIENFKGTEIVITGHSLGGAQCTIAGLAFSHKYPIDTFSCYTFGSPRVGDKKFKKLFNENISTHKRFVNEDDPVTMIPLPWRFSHVSKLNFLTKNDKLVYSIPYVRWKMFFSEYFQYLTGKDSSPLSDHSCSKYLEKLKKIDY